VVGLIDRGETARLVRRSPDRNDHRVDRVELTPLRRRRLEALSQAHLHELRRIAPALGDLLRSLDAAPAPTS
jgi:DNA-binding MarR family transcriptional regulator